MSEVTSPELTNGSPNASSRVRKRSWCDAEERNVDDSVKRVRVEESPIETEVATTNKNEGASPGQCNEPSPTTEEDRRVERGHVDERQDSCSAAVDAHVSNGQSELTSSANDAEDDTSSVYDSGGGTPKAQQPSDSVRKEDTGGSDSCNEDESEALKEGKQPHLTKSTWSQSDTLQYRVGYPGKEDDLELNDNYRFYANEIPSCPDGDLIDTIHQDWWGQYSKLEYHHGYIQWLFPIRERGMNYHSQELQLHEAKSISSDPVMHGRVLKSYELMLDFYGMKLKDKNTGEIERADNWKECFNHLNHSSHNYLRITRILKCLGEMEYEHLKAPFLRFVLHEAIVEGTLDHTLDSCINYWIEVLRDDQERTDVKKFVDQLKNN